MPVLVVHPNAPLRRLAAAAVEAALAGAGRQARAVEAATGVEALWLLARIRPELAVVGLDLPGLAGEELVALLRSRPEHETLPVVAVAETGGEDAAERARCAGAAALLLVPFEPASVAEAIAAAGLGAAP